MIEPVRSSVTVPLAAEPAFRLFTEGIASWWPLRTHSISGVEATGCVLEGRAGGRLFERDADGAEAEWGWVRAWEPPTRLVLGWHPGRAAGTAQEVEVRFEPADGGTTVRIEHRGWEALGPDGAQMRQAYDEGWGLVLGRAYAGAAGAALTPG
jgi:uncharacterized protein YndB with AHSA1/START domain